jgi:hypothetical protein
MWYQGCGIGGQNMADKKKIIYADDLQKSIVDDVTIKGSAFAAIMRHLQDAPAVQEWISVKDRLPDKHDRYLCNVKAFSFPDLRYFAILKYDDGGFIEGKIYTDDVTHWMPLPQPPKGDNNEMS